MDALKISDVHKEIIDLERSINDQIKAFQAKYPIAVKILEGRTYVIKTQIDLTILKYQFGESDIDEEKMKEIIHEFHNHY